MTDADGDEFDVFGSSYDVYGDCIRPQHQLSICQATQLERHYPEAQTLQEAIRMASTEALRSRRETLTVDQFQEQVSIVRRNTVVSEQILDELEAIRETLTE